MLKIFDTNIWSQTILIKFLLTKPKRFILFLHLLKNRKLDYKCLRYSFTINSIIVINKYNCEIAKEIYLTLKEKYNDFLQERFDEHFKFRKEPFEYIMLKGYEEKNYLESIIEFCFKYNYNFIKKTFYYIIIVSVAIYIALTVTQLTEEWHPSVKFINSYAIILVATCYFMFLDRTFN